MPQVAVIIPTVGRSRWLLPLLQQVLEQLPPGGELCVVDQSEGEELAETVAWVSAHPDPRLHHLTRPRRGLPAARNAGLRATTAPLVVFFDDDVILAPGCLAAHVQAYQDPRLGGAVGRIEEASLPPNAPPGTNRVSRSGRIRVNLASGPAGPVEMVKGANMSFRRLALSQVGGFDEGYRGTALLEESDVSVRVLAAGWSLAFLPSAGLRHLSAPEGGVRLEPLNAQAWRFRNTALFLRRHRGRRSALWFGPVFGLIACRDALRRRDLGVVPTLWGQLIRGWREGAHTKPVKGYP